MSHPKSDEAPWDDSSALILTEFKCQTCNCHDFHWPESEQRNKIVETGVGLTVRYGTCLNPDCYCHTGVGRKPTQILMRDTELAKLVS